ncbi:MAG: ABC transporter permease subunit [Candidatus Acetothermia bacterium]
MKNIWLLFKKEVLTAVRDRRTAILVLIFPLIFYPTMLGVIFHFTTQNVTGGSDTISRIVYVNREETLDLAKRFDKKDNLIVSYYPTVEGGEKGFARSGDVLLITDQKSPSGINVDLRYRKYNQESEIALSRTQQVLESYLTETLKQRLSSMGVDYEDISQPMSISVKPTESEENSLGQEMLEMMLPYFVILSIITAAMGLGAEITAGEKEKKTISTLLVSTLSRRDIVLGKFLTVFSVGTVAAVSSVIGLIYGLRIFGLNLPLDKLTPTIFGSILATVLPLIAILSALVISIGSFSRTQKEANIYQTPVLMVVVLTGILSMSGGINFQSYAYFIPLLNSLEIFKELIGGVINPLHIGANFLTNTPIAVFLIFVSIGLFKRENILFRL